MTSLEEMDFEGYKSGFVALVGKPNVGKSTILNHFIGQKIAAVSYRPQTTRRRQLGILTTQNAQIIFVDTPGLHSEEFKLSRFINEEAQYALMDSDLILFTVDASQPPDEADKLIAEEVKSRSGDAKKLLVLNKMDIVDPSVIDSREDSYKSLMDFDGSIRISANTLAGRDALLERIIELLPNGPKYYPEEQITDIYEREIAEDIIRAAALNYLQDEVPYGIFVQVNDYVLRPNDTRYVHATVYVERESQKGIVIGKKGSMIKKISTLARQEIEEMSGESVYLELQVKVEKNWRNNPDFLRTHGLSHD